MLLTLTLAFTVTVLTAPFAHAITPCEEAILDPANEVKEIDALALSKESYRISDLLNPDPAKNLVYQHPAMLLDAFQWMNAIINSMGTERVFTPGYTSREVTLYNIFSRPSVENGNSYIVNQLESIEAAVENIHEAANGNKRARSRLLGFMGPGGTGKSLIVGNYNRAEDYLSTNDPRFFRFSFEFVNLEGIDELAPIVKTFTDANGKLRSLPIPSPQPGQPPIVLLPPEYQQAILNMAGARAAELANANPNPFLKLPGYTRKILLDLDAYYKRTDPNYQKSSEYFVRTILHNHVRITRYVRGLHGGDGFINPPGRDVNMKNLTLQYDPSIGIAFGANHPWAYRPAGKIAAAYGGLVHLEEALRTENVDWYNQMMELSESDVVQIEGSEKLHTNTVKIFTSNYESKEKLRNKGLSALIDSRVTEIHWLREIHPTLIHKTLWFMMNANLLKTRSLPLNPNEPLRPADLWELFPEGKRPDEKTAPLSRRVALHWDAGLGRKPIFISPHAMELMSYTIALTRMSFNADPLREHGIASGVIDTPYFTNPVDRLKVLTGEPTNITPQQREELRLASKHLREGNEGIDQRNAADHWLTAVLREAQRDGNYNTVTPELVLRVFKSIIFEDKKLTESTEKRLEWTRFIDLVNQEFVLPWIIKDVAEVMGQNPKAADTYDRVIAELAALSVNANATQYTGKDGGQKRIDLDRLKAVEAIYKEIYNDSFPLDEIMHLVASNPNSTYRHELLWNAVQQYENRKLVASMNFDNILDDTTNNPVVQALMQQFGYNEWSARKAIELYRNGQNQQAQANGN